MRSERMLLFMITYLHDPDYDLPPAELARRILVVAQMNGEDLTSHRIRLPPVTFDFVADPARVIANTRCLERARPLAKQLNQVYGAFLLVAARGVISVPEGAVASSATYRAVQAICGAAMACITHDRLVTQAKRQGTALQAYPTFEAVTRALPDMLQGGLQEYNSDPLLTVV